MSSTPTALYPDALLARYSYLSNTSSSEKASAAPEGTPAGESAPHPEHHHEPRSWHCHEPRVQAPPVVTYCNAASDTGPNNLGVPVAVYLPVFQEPPSPPPAEEPLPKRRSPPPAPSECGRWWYLPSTAAAIALTACLLVALAYVIRTEDNTVNAEAAPLVNSSALDSGSDCPCHLATSTRGGHNVTSGWSTKTVVADTTQNTVTVRHQQRAGSNGQSSTTHPPAPKVASQSTLADNVGRVVPANPALYALGDPSSESLVPQRTTPPNTDKAAADAGVTEGGRIVRGSDTQGHDNEDSVAEVTSSNTLLPEEIEVGGEDSIQEV